jgi:hypothetical protein
MLQEGLDIMKMRRCVVGVAMVCVLLSGSGAARALDVMPLQVEVDVRIVQLTLDDLSGIGIELGASGDASYLQDIGLLDSLGEWSHYLGLFYDDLEETSSAGATAAVEVSKEVKIGKQPVKLSVGTDITLRYVEAFTTTEREIIPGRYWDEPDTVITVDEDHDAQFLALLGVRGSVSTPVPFFKDLEIVGRLFMRTAVNENAQELCILVAARLTLPE